jgi:two-component system, OmpR family, response regulator
MARVLVIEGDRETAVEIVSCLSVAGFQPEQMIDDEMGLDLALAERFDAIVFDPLSASFDELQLIRTLREVDSNVPALVVSTLSAQDDHVMAQRTRGDDYLAKPFASNELVTRLEMLLRRYRQRGKAESQVQVGDLKLDQVTREAQRGSRRIELLPIEFRLLEFMMRNAGQHLSRRMIFEAVWDYYFDPGAALIDAHIDRLKTKIDLPGATPLISLQPSVGTVIFGAVTIARA